MSILSKGFFKGEYTFFCEFRLVQKTKNMEKQLESKHNQEYTKMQMRNERDISRIENSKLASIKEDK